MPKDSIVQLNCPFYDQELCLEIYSKEGDQKEDFVFFHPHQDEITSIQVGKEFINHNGGKLISVVDKSSPSTRNIQVKHDGLVYEVDPNRIFTENGICIACNITNDEVVKIIQSYANHITDMFDEYECVVALHNNKNNKGIAGYSIENYLPGGENEVDAKDVYFDSINGTANFFITNNLEIWSKIKEAGFNAVLYDVETALDKGYLSFYVSNFLHKKYVNIEAKRGANAEQTAMLNLLVRILSR